MEQKIMSNFTAEGRKRGNEKQREQSRGWPKVTTTWAKAMKEGFRRFDEPGMEVRLKPSPLAKRSGW
jgi:hypothetical protein